MSVNPDIVNSPEVRAARAAYDAARNAPNLELLRDGKMIAGEVCRFTAGSYALIRAANVPGIVDRKKEPTPFDTMKAVWLLSENNLDAGVWIADAPEQLDKLVKKWMRGLSRRAINRACLDFMEWFASMNEATPDPEDDAGGTETDPDWALTLVDALAHEYGWTRDYILWSLPFPVAAQLQDRIAARLGNRERVAKIKDESIELLKAAEEARERLESQDNG